MTDRMNGFFVFNTNTVVSGLLFPNSKPAQALLKAQEIGFVVCSEATYDELADVLLRPKFDKYLSQQSREQFLVDYRNVVLLVDIIRVVNDCRDARDNKFLEVAINAGASHLISGDADLLIWHPYGNVQIVSPADCLLA